MSIADTPEVQRWLDRFDSPDKPTALALIQSLRIVSSNTFHRELERNIRQVADLADTPVALFVSREMRAGEDYFAEYIRQPAIVRADDEEIGSEGQLSSLATQFNRSNANRFLNHPSLQAIHVAGCRHLVILDDLSGSGNRLVEFIDAWRRSKTFRSWWSYGRISIHIAAYAVSREAEDRVRARLYSVRANRAPGKLTFTYTRRPTGSRELWAPALCAKVEEICERYGIATGIDAFSLLGYGGLMGNLVFHHGCPDNAPGILWKTCGGWPAIFPDRSVPPAFKSGEEHLGSLHDPSNLLNLLDAKKVGEGQLFHRLSPLGRTVLLLLAAVRAKAGRHEERLLAVTGFTRAEYDEVASYARQNGLLDEHALLTERGRRELRHAEKAGTMPLEPPPISDEFYFPRALRAARD